MKARCVVQTGLTFLGSRDPLASASGKTGNYRSLQTALAVYHKSQNSYHSSLLETESLTQAGLESPK